jgi:hypothetical protein
MYTEVPNVGRAQPPPVLRDRRLLAALSLIYLSFVWLRYLSFVFTSRSNYTCLFFWVEDWIIDLQYLCGECQ